MRSGLLFISHGHNDHIGGLSGFLEMNHRAKIILSDEIPGAEYASVRRYYHSITGNVDFQKYHQRFIFIHEDTFVDGIHIYTHLAHHHAKPLGDRTLLIKTDNGEYVGDDFSHELAFVIGDVLFTGCAHHGILNILESIQELIRLSIGGFHLLDSHLSEYYETDEQLQEIASELANRYPDVVFYTGHCTGDHCFEVLSREKGLRIHQFHVGKMCQ